MARSFAAVFSLLAVAVAGASCLAVGVSPSRFFILCLAAFWAFAVIGYVVGRAGEFVLAELADVGPKAAKETGVEIKGRAETARTETKPTTETAKK